MTYYVVLKTSNDGWTDDKGWKLLVAPSAAAFLYHVATGCDADGNGSISISHKNCCVSPLFTTYLLSTHETTVTADRGKQIDKREQQEFPIGLRVWALHHCSIFGKQRAIYGWKPKWRMPKVEEAHAVAPTELSWSTISAQPLYSFRSISSSMSEGCNPYQLISIQ